MGGPFMMNLKVAVEVTRPFSSHVFWSAPRIVRPESLIAVVQSVDGKVASPAPPPVQVESASVVTKPDSAAVVQHVYLAERYWRAARRRHSAPLPGRGAGWRRDPRLVGSRSGQYRPGGAPPPPPPPPR